VRLLDFGLAKVSEPALPASQSMLPTAVSEAHPLTMEGAILGTLQYMSPMSKALWIAERFFPLWYFSRIRARSTSRS